MTTTVRAVFENGVFRPTAPPALADGEEVELTVTRTPPPGLTQEEALRRVREAKTLTEMWQAAELAARFEPDDGYDPLAELDRQRRATGQRPLIPDAEAP